MRAFKGSWYRRSVKLPSVSNDYPWKCQKFVCECQKVCYSPYILGSVEEPLLGRGGVGDGLLGGEGLGGDDEEGCLSIQDLRARKQDLGDSRFPLLLQT